jgi:hypothetical protein
MSEFAENNVMARIKFSQTEREAVKDLAQSSGYTALEIYYNAIEYYLSLDKSEHKYLYASTRSCKPQTIWIQNKQYEKVAKFAEKVDQAPARVIFTATIKYLMENNRLN